MKEYTIGIILDKELNHVILIQKTHPEWQKGLFNFPGGHVEQGETYTTCISREIKEECDLNIPEEDWNFIGELVGEDYNVRVFSCIWNLGHGFFISKTDEEVVCFNINSLPKNIITNLEYLIPFAINYYKNSNTIVKFGKFYY